MSSGEMSSVKCCSLMSSSFWGPVFAKVQGSDARPFPGHPRYKMFDFERRALPDE
jgi:hypothetical protein